MTNSFVDESHGELKSAVRELCRDFPDKYWRELDEKRAYPEVFVQALTNAGYMATLIPEEYGGAGLGVTEASVILEEIQIGIGRETRVSRGFCPGLDERRVHGDFNS